MSDGISNIQRKLLFSATKYFPRGLGHLLQVMRTKKTKQGLQTRTGALATSGMKLEMSRKHLPVSFSDVIDKFNLFDVLLSYRNSNNARKDAARQSCRGNKAVKVKARNMKRLDMESKFSLAMGE